MSDNKKSLVFQRLYDVTIKRNYWLLDSFDPGAINVQKAYDMAVKFAHNTGVPLTSVYINEVPASSSFRYFKYLTSNVSDQKKDPQSDEMENVYHYISR